MPTLTTNNWKCKGRLGMPSMKGHVSWSVFLFSDGNRVWMEATYTSMFATYRCSMELVMFNNVLPFTWIGASSEFDGQVFVLKVILDMPHLVVSCNEPFHVNLRALFYPKMSPTFRLILRGIHHLPVDGRGLFLPS